MCKGENWSWGERKNKEQEGGIAKEESSDVMRDDDESPQSRVSMSERRRMRWGGVEVIDVMGVWTRSGEC